MSQSDKTTDLALYRRVLDYAWRYWPLFLLSLVGFAAGNGAEVYMARVLADFMENWGQPSALDGKFLVISIMSAALIRGLGAVLGEVFLSRISFRVVHNIRTELFQNLLFKPAAFFDKAKSGRLVSMFSFSVLQLRDTATDALKAIIQDGSKVIFLLAGMLYTSWLLSVVFLITVPFVALVAALASSRFRRVSTRIQDSMGEVTHIASEAIEAQPVVRSFDGYARETNRFFAASNVNRRRQVRLAMTKATSVQIIQILVAGALVGLMYLLLQPEIGASLSSGDVLFFLSLAALLAKPVKKLSEVNAKLQRGLAAAEEVFGALDAPVEQDEGVIEATELQGRIQFTDVTFTYDEDADPTLNDVSFTVAPGETLAIVGRTGSGKSTLLKLIPRLYHAQQGSISIDGVDLADYTLKSLRNQISTVDQNIQLFNTTIKENIAYGSVQKIDEADLQRVIVNVGLSDFIATLPNGLDTLVGDRGARLSGGQRQRIALARALLKERPILLLDEATSALDQETERVIQNALAASSHTKTTLVVAHRLDTVKKADRIMVLEQGKIIEVGTHSELLTNNGAYAKLSQQDLIASDEIEG